MEQVSRRTGFTGPALIRLLARLTDGDARESRQAFADRLSQWLNWTDAISLSSALNGSPVAAPAGARASASAAQAECTRTRAALAKAIADDSAPAPSMNTPADFSPHRRRYLARQQAMEAGIGPLRARLRATLAAGSPAMARLAGVDAVMEQVLVEHERRLLSTVPVLLEKHFERLRQADQPPNDPDSEARPGAWLDMFRKDMQDVLLAELDLRMQPIEGLLEALRMRQPKLP
jgi:hypothetical protein